MRWKIISVNAGIVVVLAVLTYFLLAASLTEVVANRGEQKRELLRALRAAESQLALDGLRMERWLTQASATEPVQEVFRGGTAAARSESATSAANTLRDRAASESEFAGMAPALVAFVDERGIGIGRNGSELMRGDKLAAAYPGLARALESGSSRSDVWIDRQRQEQMLVSYAPVRDGEGRISGALVLGTPLNDERMARTSELTSGHSLAFLQSVDQGFAMVAGTGAGVQGAKLEPVVQAAARALGGAGPVQVGEPVDERLYGAVRLSGYPDATGVIVASLPAERANLADLLWPIFAVAGLGVALVAAGGVLLGNYISRPVAEMEEGLLMVISGNQNLRFELKHEELGGLASRINTLLNTLLGVAEDNTDAQGHPAAAASARNFNEALAVDESVVSQPGHDVASAEALAATPADQYYARLYEAYLRAKQQLGEAVDHITFEAFQQRIRQSEQEMQAKHGRPVRYQVEIKAGAVVLIAVPLTAAVS
jgi:hypothetical protein